MLRNWSLDENAQLSWVRQKFKKTVGILLYNRVFNYYKQHVYYVSINNFIYHVSKNNFLEWHVYNNMLLMSLVLDWVIFGMS